MSVHRGEGVCLSACWDARPPPPDQADTPQTRQTPPGPGRHPPDQADTPPRPGRPPPPPDQADSSIRSTSGRYASYWNAFLLSLLQKSCQATYSLAACSSLVRTCIYLGPISSNCSRVLPIFSSTFTKSASNFF